MQLVVRAVVLAGIALGAAGCSAGAADVRADGPATATGTATAGGGTPVSAAPDGGSSPEKREPGQGEELEIVESAAWPGEMGDLAYAVVVENPSDELAYFSSGFDISVMGVDNQQLDASTTYVTVAPGARTAIMGGFSDIYGRGATYLMVDTPEVATVVEPGSVGYYEVLDAEIMTRADGRTGISGSVVSHFATDQEHFGVAAVLRDADGEIVDAAGGFVLAEPDGPVLDTFAPGTTASYWVDLDVDGAADLVPEVFVVPAGTGQGPNQ
ncbi:hypothetical protein Slu03_12280 [Sediminihabitans luteus]|nr:hypothetical protein Slu03_12280 [Sediminihabitans luteus]